MRLLRDRGACGFEITAYAVFMESEFPRALTAAEQEVLDFLLQAEFAGVGALREQARHAVVTGICDCGCPSFGLEVDQSQAVRAGTNPKAPVDVEAGSLSDDSYCELLLFTDDGWLSGVELVWYGGDAPPLTFPPVSSFDSPKQQYPTSG